jgi:multisubunit Na+/H+ antiporter MnhB subunit
MEVLEAKPASRRARLWARLSDPDKRPRIWWFPPSSRREVVRRIPEAARQEYQKVVQQGHEKFSETVRLAMLSLLGFALFCLLITFSAPDSTLLVADPTIKMPFADVQVSFLSFLILAPFLLIVVTLYLHIFYGYWLDLETDHQHLTCSRELGEPPMEHLPTLFSLDHWVPRLLTAFIFYWLVPLVLVTITWKAAVRPAWGLPLMVITGLVTVILVFLRIRRCPASQRQRNRRRWLVMGLIVAGLVALTFNPQWRERR